MPADYRSSALRDQLAALMREGDTVMADRHDRSHAGLSAGERTDPGFRMVLPSGRVIGGANSAAKLEDDTAEVEQADGDERAQLYIYSEIGGWFGVWPDEVVYALSQIKGDVDLHIHSPGGDAFDGVAIYNALRDHDGKVYGSVDGLAASAASVIAMAADELTVKLGGQLMIHDAWGVAIGPAEDMGKMQNFLNKVSDATAEIYAAKAGGEPKDWRKAMKAETWYTGKEAAEAGLADKVETATESAKNHWNMKVFQHAGRENAPAPAMPAGRRGLTGRMANSLVDLDALAAATQNNTQTHANSGVTINYDALNGGAGVPPAPRPAQSAVEPSAQPTPAATPQSVARVAQQIHRAALRAAYAAAVAEGDDDDQTPDADPATGPTTSKEESSMPHDPTKIREALGLGPAATDAEVQAAWAAAFAPSAPAPTTPETPAAPAQNVDLGALAKQAEQMGVVLIDPSQLQVMQQMAERGQQAYEKQRVDERDSIIKAAVVDGRVEPSRVEHWQKAWDADPEGARSMLERLSPNLVPMEAAGYAGSVAASQADNDLYAMYPEMKPQGGGRRG